MRRLSGKDFLFNVGNIITVYILTLLLYLLVWAGSRIFQRLRTWKVQYEKTGLYCSVLFSFLEITLSACVQLKFVHSPLSEFV